MRGGSEFAAPGIHLVESGAISISLLSLKREIRYLRVHQVPEANQ
jgi:hypothetical protein